LKAQSRWTIVVCAFVLTVASSGPVRAEEMSVRYARSLSPALPSDAGWLSITSAPLGAQIDASNAQLQGRTTPYLTQLPAGTYRFTVTRSDYDSVSAEVEVRPGYLCAVDAALVAEFAVLSSQSGTIRWNVESVESGDGVVVPFGEVRVRTDDGVNQVLEPVYPMENRARLASAIVPISLGVTILLGAAEALLPIETPASVPLVTVAGMGATVGALSVAIPIQIDRRRYLSRFEPPRPDYFAADAQALMDEAVRLVANGDTDAATDRYSTVIERYANVPVVTDALYARARLAFARGEYERARDDLLRVVTEYPHPDVVDQAGLFLAEVLLILEDRAEFDTLFGLLPMLEGSGVAEEMQSILDAF
jgi:hypothetical protein